MNLYYSRSGRFTTYGNDDVFAGGLLISPTEAIEIEVELAKQTEAAGYFLDLTIGTNRHLPDLLELSLDVLSDFSSGFFAVAMRTVEGDLEPDILTSVRTQYEAEILSAGSDFGLFESGFVDLFGVRHAERIDDTIYKRLMARNVFSAVQLFESHASSSHLYRLSSVLTKCLAATHYDRALTNTREKLRGVVLNRYEISEPVPVNANLSIIPIK